jgi:hypothetical protein
MVGSSIVMSVGALLFGVSVGFITYRTLVRTTDKAAVSDLGAVVSVIGGGAVTALFDPRSSDLFGWYSIGLATGMIVFFVLFLSLNGVAQTASVMSGRTITGSGTGPGAPQA